MPIPWMSQLPTSPSKNGSSTEFYISATQSYSNALFWDHLGAQDFANHLTWVLAYTSAAIRRAPQTLEYDLFQYVGGREYMFRGVRECGVGLRWSWSRSGSGGHSSLLMRRPAVSRLCGVP